MWWLTRRSKILWYNWICFHLQSLKNITCQSIFLLHSKIQNKNTSITVQNKIIVFVVYFLSNAWRHLYRKEKMGTPFIRLRQNNMLWFLLSKPKQNVRWDYIWFKIHINYHKEIFYQNHYYYLFDKIKVNNIFCNGFTFWYLN